VSLSRLTALVTTWTTKTFPRNLFGTGLRRVENNLRRRGEPMQMRLQSLRRETQAIFFAMP